MINAAEAYTYDAQGVRLTRLNQTHTTQYYFHDTNLLFTKRDGQIDVRYLYDDGAVYCAVYNDIPYWYNTDIRGSVTNILKGDATSSITTTLNKSYVYDAYGNTDVTSTTEFRNSIAYTGAIFDQETGLYYLMSRYYDPAIAQFISEDSYRGDGEHFWNLYMYCEGDPVNNVDRTGESIYGIFSDLVNNFPYTVKYAYTNKNKAIHYYDFYFPFKFLQSLFKYSHYKNTLLSHVAGAISVVTGTPYAGIASAVHASFAFGMNENSEFLEEIGVTKMTLKFQFRLYYEKKSVVYLKQMSKISYQWKYVYYNGTYAKRLVKVTNTTYKKGRRQEWRHTRTALDVKILKKR